MSYKEASSAFDQKLGRLYLTHTLFHVYQTTKLNVVNIS